MKKRIFATVLTIALMFSLSGVCFAAESVFSKVPIDSNEYELVTTAKKDTTGSNAEIKITAFYKADGSSSWTYTKAWVKATSSGEGRIGILNVWVPVPIPSAYRSAGKYVDLYAHGFNPSLDCCISGYWNVH